MGDDIDLEILVKVDENQRFQLISGIIDSFLQKGARVDERFPPCSYNDFKDIPGSLDDVKSVISEEGGTISFIYDGFTFNMHYNPEKSHKLIGMSCSKSYFKEEDRSKFIRYFVDFSKIIWNSIIAEKIYGLADLDDYVDVFREGLDKFDLREPTRWWINFYGQKLIEKIGLETIAADGDYNMENVKDGVMLITKKIPNQIA